MVWLSCIFYSNNSVSQAASWLKFMATIKDTHIVKKTGRRWWYEYNLYFICCPEAKGYIWGEQKTLKLHVSFMYSSWSLCTSAVFWEVLKCLDRLIVKTSPWQTSNRLEFMITDRFLTINRAHFLTCRVDWNHTGNQLKPSNLNAGFMAFKSKIWCTNSECFFLKHIIKHLWKREKYGYEWNI